MLNAKAFGSTTVAVDRSMAEIDKLLSKHGVRENRFTHRRPLRPGVRGPEGVGAIVYEFVVPEAQGQERRGVRVAVTYQEEVGPQGGRRGITAEMAGRALFWHLKSKFDSIAFGIEGIDVAFMPYLVTALPDGRTFAEAPALIGEALQRPENVGSLLALPEPQSS